MKIAMKVAGDTEPPKGKVKLLFKCKLIRGLLLWVWKLLQKSWMCILYRSLFESLKADVGCFMTSTACSAEDYICMHEFIRSYYGWVHTLRECRHSVHVCCRQDLDNGETERYGLLVYWYSGSLAGRGNIWLCNMGERGWREQGAILGW